MSRPDAHPGPEAAAHPRGDESRLLEAMEEYWQAVQEGRAPDRDDFLRRHPDLADQLDACLDGLAFIRQAAAGLSEVGPPMGTATPPGLGMPLGDYRILREVGRGGMGVVYEAEQMSLGRRVALKVLPLAATMDPRHLQRFHNEARAAASLHHEHIAPVYGVGQERGVHYFAMQFLDGQTLAAFLDGLRRPAPEPRPEPTTAYTPPPDDAARADTAPRAAATTEQAPRDLAYFRQVAGWGIAAAQALDYAHSLGIVHRDVKPGNLMLDGQGKLWVTDFGLARTAADSNLTMTGDLLGTLRYMSPEQALARHGLVDHRSDVYALGVTLYELLTLRPAVEGKDRQEILGKIAFEEPKAPRSLNKAIPHDLETVVLKAMAKEPAERYATAGELAEDLRRFVGDEPVQARRPSLGQRAVRWLRRHPGLLGTVSAVLAVAVVGLAVGLYAVDRERGRTSQAWQAEKKAREEEARRRRQTREAMDLLSSALIDEWLTKQEVLLPEHRAFLKKALAAYEEFAADVGEDEDVRAGVAAAHLRVGGIQKKLGQAEAAEKAYQRSITLYRELASDFPDVPEYRSKMASGHIHLGLLLMATGRLSEAEATYRDALALEKQLADDFPGVPVYRSDLATSLTNLGLVFRKTGRAKEAEETYLQALAINKQLAADFPGAPKPRSDQAASLANLGTVFQETGRTKEAEEAYGQALAVDKQLADDFPGVPEYRSHLAGSHLNLGDLRRKMGRAKEAEEDLGEALAVWRQLVADFPGMPEYRANLAVAHNNLGTLFRKTLRVKEAEAAYREALAIQTQLAADFAEVPGWRSSRAMSLYNLGRLLGATGRRKEAEEAYREAVAIRKRLIADYPDVPEYRGNLGATLNNLAALLARSGQLEKCRALLEEAIRHQCSALQAEPRHPTFRRYLRNHYSALAVCLLKLGEHGEAAEAAGELARSRDGQWEDTLLAIGLLTDCAARAAQDPQLDAEERQAQADGYTAQAGEMLRQAAQHLPDNPQAQNHLAWLLATHPDPHLRDPALAVQLAHKAVARAEDNAAIQNTLGVAHYRNGDWKEAIQALTQSAELGGGGSSGDFFFLAMAHWQLGDKEQARQWYDKGVAWMQKHEEDEELARFRSEAEALLGIPKSTEEKSKP